MEKIAELTQLALRRSQQRLVLNGIGVTIPIKEAVVSMVFITIGQGSKKRLRSPRNIYERKGDVTRVAPDLDDGSVREMRRILSVYII